MRVELTQGNRYEAKWFDPRDGSLERSTAAPDGRFTAPDRRDWALAIRKTGGNAKPAPIAVSGALRSMRGEAASFRLAAIGAGVGYRIVTPPKHGILSGSGAERVYKPAAGFTGRDRIEWRVGASNVATVDIVVNATGKNAPPRAEDQAVDVAPGATKSFILLYTDEDGPGPYDIRVVSAPAHGKLVGRDNDVTYTPAPGFTGEDSFQWVVSDGEVRSERATVRVRVF